MLRNGIRNPDDLITLNNISPAAPWQPKSFQLDRLSGAVKSIWNKRDVEASPQGFGSYVLLTSRLWITRHFIAVYLTQHGWRCFNGGREYDLSAASVEWGRGYGLFGGLCAARLELKSKEYSDAVNYFRPWLRHWFEGGWSMDDTDIGWTTARIASDGSSRLRLAKALGIDYSESSAVR